MSKISEIYLEVNHIKEYSYHVFGEGLPVVLYVHGSGTPDSLFAYLQAKDYEKICTSVYYDQRGAGKTYSANKKVIPTYSDMKWDLYETVLRVNEMYRINKVILVANSLGTIISAPFVIEHPELVSKFIVSGFIPNMKQGEKWIYECLKEKATLTSDKATMKKLLTYEDYPYDHFDSRAKKAISAIRKLEQSSGLTKPVSSEMKQMLMKSPIFHYSDLFTMIRSPRINQTLFSDIWDYDALSYGPNYQVPVYFLHGEEDYVAPLCLAKAYYEKINAPIKEFITIPHAGHITGFDNKEAYNKEFIRIITEANQA